MRRTALCLSLALIATENGVGQKTPDVRLDTGAPAGWSIRPEIATAGDSVYVTWYDTSPARRLYVNASSDRGATWLSTPVSLGTGSTWNPQIAAHGSSVYVAWLDDRLTGPGTDIFVNYSKNRGVTWLDDDVRINTDPPASATSTHPEIAVAGNAVYVTWFDLRHGFRSGDVYVNASADGGATWLNNDVRLNSNAPGSAWSTRPQVAAEGDSVYVAWQDSRNGALDIYVNRSLNQGATWLDEDVRLNTDPPGAADAALPQIAAIGARVYATWQDHRNGSFTPDIYLNYSADRGTTWQPADLRLDSGVAASTDPQIAVAGNSVYVVWTEAKQNGDTDIFLNSSADGGATWQGARRVDRSQGGATEPQVAAHGNSVYVTWQAARPFADFDVLFNRSTDGGATWLSRDLRLDTSIGGTGVARFPRIVATESLIGVTWEDYRGITGPSPHFNIPLGLQPYGAATTGSGGVAPALTSTGMPTLGGSPALDVTNGLGGAAGAVLLGANKTELNLLGGTLLVDPSLSIPLGLGGAPGTPGTGNGTVPLSIPNIEAILGTDLYFQGVFFDAGAPRGVSMTNAIEMWIG